MNKAFTSSLYLLICVLSFHCTSAQKRNASETTIILLRHAEKDTSGGNNPALSAEGSIRAKRLAASFPNVVPDEFYATPYVRTISTLKPWADVAGKDVKTYAPADSIKLTETLLKQHGKTIVVTGHSNTIPVLVNLLIGTRKYKPLADSAYSNIYVVTVANGKATEKVLHY